MSIEAKGLSKSIGNPAVPILSDIDLSIPDGQFVSLTGRSGAGKSSLLYVLSTLDDPTAGLLTYSGRAVSSMSSKELHSFRNTRMGFVFQFHYLIAELTLIENVLVPARKFHHEVERRARAEELVERFGLKDKLHRFPRQLSGGEMQRVAIARALLMQPQYLFADEPTGALDTANAETVLAILKEVNEVEKTTVVMVTHDPDFAKLAERQIRLADGRIVEDFMQRKSRG